jgi:nitrite reductase/ring-hydroxylating ferredoxin subunit
VWKSLHMLVYVAYALLVMHVALGVLQSERHVGLAALLGFGTLTLGALHVAAARRERPADEELAAATDVDDFVPVCRVGDIREKRARLVCLGGERIAVFKYDGKVSAISNVCQHQNGPLAEGKIVDGCVTCPWHGYQYRPASGASPPPFTEKVPTFNVKVVGEQIYVDPRPLPPGTEVEPARIAGAAA